MASKYLKKHVNTNEELQILTEESTSYKTIKSGFKKKTTLTTFLSTICSFMLNVLYSSKMKIRKFFQF